MADRFRTPFVSRTPYQRGSLGELIARRGDIEAQGALQSGNAWANAISDVGNIAAGAFQQYGAQKEERAAAKAKELAERPAREMAAERSKLEMEKLRRESKAVAEADAKKAGTAEAFAGAIKSPSRTKAFEMVANDPEATKMLTESYDRRDKARNTAFGEIAATVRRFGDSDAAVAIALEDLAEEGYDAAMVAQVSEALKDPARRGMIVDSFLKSSPDEGHKALVRPEKKETDKSYSEAELAYMAAQGDQGAAKALESLNAESVRHNRAMEAKGGQKKEITPTMEANIVNRLNTQWSAANKTAKELNNQVRLMDAGLNAAERGDLAQGAQAVLVTFQKILDPGSVVRESEFARSAAGQSVLTRIEGAFEKLTKGGAGVPLGELRKFADLAREAVKAQQADMPATRRRIGSIADRYSIPHELIFDDAVAPAGPQPPPRTPVPDSGKDPLGIRK